jgi:hypothetical protein
MTGTALSWGILINQHLLSVDFHVTGMTQMARDVLVSSG